MIRYLQMAEEMLGTAVPRPLATRLTKIDELARTCGGALVSRQIVAVAVEQWLRNKRKVKK